MNCMLLLPQFGIRLNGPTSTSKSRAVAIRFAGERGIVLKMNIEQPFLHFFDCVGFSQFPEEDERLMFGGRWPLMVKSVLVMKTAKNFSRCFGVLSVFDCVVSGGRVKESAIPPKKDHKKLDHLSSGVWVLWMRTQPLSRILCIEHLTVSERAKRRLSLI